jgi:addiction module RelB/DinJ family antitoxin
MTVAAVNYTIRLDEAVKKEAEQVFDQIGLTLAAGINVYLKAVGQRKKIPFTLEGMPTASRAERQRDAFARFMAAMNAAPPLPDEFDEILSHRVNIAREADL